MRLVGFLLCAAIGFNVYAGSAVALEFQADTTPTGEPFIMITGDFKPDEDLRPFAQLAAMSGAKNVAFNSPGGSIYKAMELGRMIRRLDLGTIAVRQLECASACALAFLGGTMRYAQPGSIGVHRSSFGGDDIKGSPEEAIAAIQQVTADVIQFIVEMGADPAFLGVALSYDSTDIRYLSGSEMDRYRISTPTPSPLPDEAPPAASVPIPTPRPDEQQVAGPTEMPLSIEPIAVPSDSDDDTGLASLVSSGPANDQILTTLGSVVWQGIAPDALQGTVRVRGKLDVELWITRANSSELLRGGQISVSFRLAQSFKPGGVGQITGLWMRKSASGYFVKIEPYRVDIAGPLNKFDIAFGVGRIEGAGDGMRQISNRAALSSYELLCLGLAFDSGETGSLCLHKGKAGRPIFRDVFWSGEPAETPISEPQASEMRFGRVCKTECVKRYDGEFCARYCVCMLHELMETGTLFNVVSQAPPFPAKIDHLVEQCTEQTAARLSRLRN